MLNICTLDTYPERLLARETFQYLTLSHQLFLTFEELSNYKPKHINRKTDNHCPAHNPVHRNADV